MRALSTAFLWSVVLLTAPVGYLLGVLLWLVTAPFDGQRRALHAFICGWCHTYLHLWPGWRVRVEGRRLLPRGPCVLIANHQSMADILAVMGLRTGFKFVSKASLFEVPLVGWMMRRLRYVALERGRQASHQALLEVGGALLEAGEKLLIFPEGTYASGAERLPFKRGAFHLAQRHQVPLVPIVIEGTGALVFEDGPAFAPRARVTVRVMEPLTPPPREADEVTWLHHVEGLYAQWLGQPFHHAEATTPTTAR